MSRAMQCHSSLGLVGFAVSSVLYGCGAHSVFEASAVERQEWLAQPLAPVQAGLCKPVKRQIRNDERCGTRVANLLSPLTGVSLDYREQGFAGRTVDDSGHVHGTHFSGDTNAPMVTEEDGCVSAQCVQALWQAATGLYLEVASNLVPTKTQIQAGSSIGMNRDSGNGLSVNWLGAPPSRRAERVVELMGEMEIGYW